ncbi:acetylornithine deacetylase [Mesorhizobium sp. CO1-1-8]|uniref:acetylornithine deacetylase n=1 Tax=Mesorhizobium sp. CO1-1-8 TaxID=2876631 RepID=UPI001CD09D92|nr:acetylornithine deacetylase [Mesorhizobium sp. CO1-1-8]MBZ9772236.1 acetylornithine deacetylase [Mesorhizobium sp. CO1-1-8]
MHKLSAVDHLDRLIAFNTVSSRSNTALIDWIEVFCRQYSARVRRFPNNAGDKTCLFVSLGPDALGGIVLSAHTDVVPTEGQAWHADPFTMRRDHGRLIGRGATDMKGFIACCLAVVPHVSRLSLKRPLHLALSYDEEVSSDGVQPMADWLGRSGLDPALAIIGEPSSMQVVTAHKGGLLNRVRIKGKPGHSSQPDRHVNAVMVAAQLIAHIEAVQRELRAGPVFSGLDPAYSTTQVNMVHGGTAQNIVAEHCEFSWEARFIPGQDDLAMVEAVKAFAARELEPAMKAIDNACGIEFIIEAHVPALRPNANADLERHLMELLGQSAPKAVSYGSEAGIFQAAGVPAIICGPGDIAQAHQPEEFIAQSDLDSCVDFLVKVAGTLT